MLTGEFAKFRGQFLSEPGYDFGYFERFVFPLDQDHVRAVTPDRVDIVAGCAVAGLELDDHG